MVAGAVARRSRHRRRHSQRTVSNARRAPHARTATATPTVRKSRRPSRYSKARAARARALWLEAQSPRYKLDDTGTMVPDIRAAAAIIYNPDNGQVLWEENSQRQAVHRQHHESDDRVGVPRERTRI